MAVHENAGHFNMKPPVHTGGEIFTDGSILELVRRLTGELNFLTWDGKSVQTAPRRSANGETFVPPSVDPTILHSLRLPSAPADCGSTRKLFSDICSLISRATQSAYGVAELLTFFVLAAWLVDSLPFAPLLWVVAPPTTTPAPLEQILSLLCRRALILPDISPTGLRSLPMTLRPDRAHRDFPADVCDVELVAGVEPTWCIGASWGQARRRQLRESCVPA